jgi:hypothetical protein
MKNHLRSFPAEPRTVLWFLLDAPVSGRRLYVVWKAIDRRHENAYWHTDANPVRLLKLGGVVVDEKGEVTIPERLLDDATWSD